VVAAEEPARRPTGQFTAEAGERLLGRIESLSGLLRAIARRTALRPCSDRGSCRVANVEQFVDEGRRQDAILVTFLERCADKSVELLRRVEFDCDIPNRLDQGDRGLTGYLTVAGDEPERGVDGGDHGRFRRGSRPHLPFWTRGPDSHRVTSSASPMTPQSAS
jgi:hypothetical protein